MKQYKFKELVKILNKNGFFETRKTGSHVIFKHSIYGSIPVPFKNNVHNLVNPCLSRNIIRQIRNKSNGN